MRGRTPLLSDRERNHQLPPNCYEVCCLPGRSRGHAASKIVRRISVEDQSVKVLCPCVGGEQTRGTDRRIRALREKGSWGVNKRITEERTLKVRDLLTDGMHLLRVIRLRLSEGDELVAEIEETLAEFEEISERWKGNPPRRRIFGANQ